MPRNTYTHAQFPSLDAEPKEKNSLELYADGRIRERGIDTINGYRIERIGSVTADVDDDSQPSRLTRRVDLCVREERRDGGREVDAVDEDVDVEDLLKRPTLGRLCQIPLDDLISEKKSASTSKSQSSRFKNQKSTLTRRDRSCEGGRWHHDHIVQGRQSRAP